MDYLIALGNGMNNNRPLNGCDINVHFCCVQYIKAVMYKELSKFIGNIRNVRIGNFFNVYLYNAINNTILLFYYIYDTILLYSQIKTSDLIG